MNKYTMRLEQVFIFIAGVLLMLTGAAKMFSLTGSAGILDTQDPVFSLLSTRQLLLLVALLELGVGSLAFLRSTAAQTKLILIVWLGGLFGLYRLGLWLVDYQEPCNCLGGALNWTGLSDAAIRGTTFAMFVYLLLGGSVLLLVHYCRGRRTSTGRAAAEVVALPSTKQTIQ